ncbi:hypothetical protein LY78DRAFT_358079 [Colletotrichum sublineola]|nr:hypothetical protein LY78DRAFT_358079 [Colletotrichum sublineola]
MSTRIWDTCSGTLPKRPHTARTSFWKGRQCLLGMYRKDTGMRMGVVIGTDSITFFVVACPWITSTEHQDQTESKRTSKVEDGCHGTSGQCLAARAITAARILCREDTILPCRERSETALACTKHHDGLPFLFPCSLRLVKREAELQETALGRKRVFCLSSRRLEPWNTADDPSVVVQERRRWKRGLCGGSS